ncbi:hypothetical protein [Methylibium sp.]|uniref:hypothetical protein n=1 Tax=Methylibium sp. TaxID=2067992 RepID=UPI003D14455E
MQAPRLHTALVLWTCVLIVAPAAHAQQNEPASQHRQMAQQVAARMLQAFGQALQEVGAAASHQASSLPSPPSHGESSTDAHGTPPIHGASTPAPRTEHSPAPSRAVPQKAPVVRADDGAEPVSRF